MLEPLPQDDLKVRTLVRSDWERLRAARLAALAEAPYAFGSTLAREQALPRQAWQDRASSGATVGAFAGDRILGLATGRPEQDLAGSPRAAWHLAGMWVAPALRGKGVADRLVEIVCERAAAEGAPALSLWVTEVNGRARAFYRRLGFAPTGRRQLVRPQEPDHWEEQLVLPLGRD